MAATNIIERNGNFFQQRGNGIYLVGSRNEYGEVLRLKKPRLVKRIKSRGYEEDLWGSTRRERWEGTAGSLWDDTAGSLWEDEGINLGQNTEDLFSSSSSDDNSLWDEPDHKESDQKEIVQEDTHKSFIPYKFNLEIEEPEVLNVDKPTYPWAVRLKEEDSVKLINFQSEEVYVITEDIPKLFVQAIRGESNIVPNDVPEGLNILLYHLANDYLKTISFSNFENFLKDYKSLYHLKLEESDRNALIKLDKLFNEMFVKDEYKKGDKITILLEKKVLLSNKEQAVVEIESFDTMEYVDIPKESYLYGMMKKCGGINYLKVRDKTFIIRDNKIRITHIEE